MSYCAAAIALIFTLLGKLNFEIFSTQYIVATSLASGISVTLAALCMVLACTVIFPITYSKKDAYHGNSLIFFGDIANHRNGEAGFSTDFLNTDETDYLKDLTTQVYTLSTIASKKFQKIQIITSILIVHFAVIFIFLALCFFGSTG
nr:Pycsar system effector family protein [Pseudomonas songnenensis]